MYPKEIEEYVAELFRRRDEAIFAGRAEMQGANWQPQHKECHDNVDAYCNHDNSYKPVRGWLFFDYDYLLDYVGFLQHSIIMSPDGQLIDITPSKASQDYPFIIVDESAEDFFAKEKYTNNGILYFMRKNA